MAPSQLRQLKASLRDQGLVGPQKSKKQKKVAAQDAGSRQKRSAALQSIRERFNPFEVKVPARKNKFDVAGNEKGRNSKGVRGRPGVTKGLGEERRRATLLKEIQSRNKVGQLVDRRFGENNPSMTPEQRAAERFARQSERQLRKESVFNLEDEADENAELTHMGRALNFCEADAQDDLKADLPPSESSTDQSEELSGLGEDLERPLKRRRSSESEDVHHEDEVAVQLPERKRSKHEVMKEVIAKSKLYKYERQQAKEDDDDLRAELDKGLPDFLESMRNYRKSPPLASVVEKPAASMNPDRAALLAGQDRHEADQAYNERVRQMAMDKRSKPSTRTKTEEERAAEEAARLRDLEKKRLRRMRGAPVSSDEENDEAGDVLDDREQDDAKAFGLGQMVNEVEGRSPLEVEDEDDFVLDDDLIASGSEFDLASGEDTAREDSSHFDDDGDDDFINGLVLPAEPTTGTRPLSNGISANGSVSGNLSFTYNCPTTHEEFLDILQGTNVDEVPTVVQRIRALYHPKLSAGNKQKLETFSAVLTQHVAHLADQVPHAPSTVLESLIRHLHSLAKTHPTAVAAAFRARLQEVAAARPLELRPGDLILLTAISTIFPTSDHFHPVVTPASLTIARFLNQSPQIALIHLIKGAYCCTLALQYQSLSERYIPEVTTYIHQALALLVPVYHSTRVESLIKSRNPQASSLGLTDGEAAPLPSLRFEDLYVKARTSSNDNIPTADGSREALVAEQRTKATLISHFLTLLDRAAEMWRNKSAFPEIFEPASLLLQDLVRQQHGHDVSSPNHTPPHHVPTHSRSLLHPLLATQVFTLSSKISSLLQRSLSARRPLLLHNHRPLAIKTSIPKFEETYNPNRHYDPDQERSQLNKLRAEHKRERKGAMRELRRDANFIAREQLRDKKERDEAYDRKFRRLVAEIQGTEGHHAKVYEREKAKRKGKKR